jgi:phosphatidate cytidylyltransferase
VEGGQIGFALLVALVSALALWEYYGLLLPEETVMAKGTGVFFCLAVIGGFYLAREKAAMAILIGAFFLVSVLQLFRDSPAHWTVDRIFKQVLGLVYIPLCLGHLVMIRNGAHGLSWVAMILCIVFAVDTGAYYVGKSLGRKKLCPRISPGKTVEGALGGLIAGMVFASVVKILALPQLTWLGCLILVVVSGVVAQVGDLAESVIKRSVDIKDSGTLMPGHGGVLDRIDGLLFAAPVFYYIKDIIT